MGYYVAHLGAGDAVSATPRGPGQSGVVHPLIMSDTTTRCPAPEGPVRALPNPSGMTAGNAGIPGVTPHSLRHRSQPRHRVPSECEDHPADARAQVRDDDARPGGVAQRPAR
jgi:hypothetical protein